MRVCGWLCVVVSVLVIGCAAMVARAQGDGEIVDRVRLACGAELVVDAESGFGGGDVEVWGVLWGGAAMEGEGERGAAMVAMRALLYELSERDPGAFALTGMTVEGLDSGESEGVMALRAALALTMSGSTREEMERAMGVCARIARGGSVGDRSIERALESVRVSIETREREDVGMHLRAGWLEDLMGGSGLARVSEPTAEVFEGLTLGAVRGYMGRAWRAGAMTVLVVGDVDSGWVVDRAGSVFGDVVRDDRGAFEGVDLGAARVGGRIATAHDARLDGTELGLVWFGENTIEVLDEGSLDELVTIALAGEAMRSRVNRVVRAELGEVTIAGVQVGDITSEARFAQMVVQMEGDGWEEALRALIVERTRLVRDGVVGEELDRARASLTQRLVSEGEAWSRSSARDRARSLVWMMSAGRELVDLGSVLSSAPGCVDRVSESDVHAMIVSLIGEGEPGVVVALDSREGVSRDEVARVVRAAMREDPEPIGERWVEAMHGSIVENIRAGGRVEEVRSHGASGVVEARLSNGVWVRHRSMGSSGDRATLAVHVWFGEAPDESMDGVEDVLVRAIEGTTIRSRLDPEMRTLMREYGLSVRVEHSVRSVMIEIEGPGSSLERCAELAFALLMDLRVDPSLVGAVRGEAERGEIAVGMSKSALELGIARAMGEDPGVRSARVLGEGVDARSALSFWRDAVRDGLVEIGLVTGEDAESSLGVVAPILGAVVDNEHGVCAVHELEHGAARRGVVRVEDPSGWSGVAMGFSAGDARDLAQVRTLVVGSMVLGERVRKAAESEGLGDRVYGVLVLSDLTPGHAYVAVRVGCEPGDAERALGLIGEVTAELVDTGVTEGEMGWARDRITRSLARTSEEPSYWARRLAMLGMFGQDVETLWSIGEDYARIGGAEVDEVMRSWYARGAHFSIEFVGGE